MFYHAYHRQSKIDHHIVQFVIFLKLSVDPMHHVLIMHERFFIRSCKLQYCINYCFIKWIILFVSFLRLRVWDCDYITQPHTI